MMQTIKLSNCNELALIDNEDLSLVLSHNSVWFLCQSGVYCRSKLIRGRKNKIALHRLVLQYFEKSLMDVDHIDRNKLNNQKINLRIIPHKLNIINCEKSRGITSKFKGVSWHKKARKFQVHLCKDGKRIYGGLFLTEIEAAKKANELYLKYFGIVGVLNVI